VTNDEANRRGIRGVIAAGNRNFGAGYCLAGSIIAKKCQDRQAFPSAQSGRDREPDIFLQ
jgi:hypothetical protein